MIADGANAQHNNTVHYSGSALESSFSAWGQPAAKLPITVPAKPAVTVPTTNLNIGMDLWNNSAPVGSVPIKARPNAPGVSQSIVPGPMVGREGVMPEHQWMQDERELRDRGGSSRIGSQHGVQDYANRWCSCQEKDKQQPKSFGCRIRRTFSFSIPTFISNSCRS